MKIKVDEFIEPYCGNFSWSLCKHLWRKRQSLGNPKHSCYTEFSILCNQHMQKLKIILLFYIILRENDLTWKLGSDWSMSCSVLAPAGEVWYSGIISVHCKFLEPRSSPFLTLRIYKVTLVLLSFTSSERNLVLLGDYGTLVCMWLLNVFA